VIGPRPLRWWEVELRDLRWCLFVRAESKGAARALAGRVFRFRDGLRDNREVFTASCGEVRLWSVNLLEPAPDGLRGWAQRELEEFPERWFHPESELPPPRKRGELQVQHLGPNASEGLEASP
jgi:hypothetical protein